MAQAPEYLKVCLDEVRSHILAKRTIMLPIPKLGSFYRWHGDRTKQERQRFERVK